MSDKPKLENVLRTAIRRRGYSYRTEDAYVGWYRRFVKFHGLRHPETMGEREIEAFFRVKDFASRG